MFYSPDVLCVTVSKFKIGHRMSGCEKSAYERTHESKAVELWSTKLHIVIEIERMRTRARKRERGGESSTVRELVGRAEGGIKAGGPDRLEQESKEKYLIGIKCPDRVRGRLNSAKRAAFPLAKKEVKEYKRERVKKN